MSHAGCDRINEMWNSGLALTSLNQTIPNAQTMLNNNSTPYVYDELIGSVKFLNATQSYDYSLSSCVNEEGKRSKDKINK